jgi:hypothetical protein
VAAGLAMKKKEINRILDRKGLERKVSATGYSQKMKSIIARNNTLHSN